MRRWVLALAVFALVAAACAPEETPSASGPTGETGAQQTAAECAQSQAADLFVADTLTIGTDNPVFQPWFGGTGKYQEWKANPDFGVGNPASREGFESEFAYALAERLGFTSDHVDWAALNFNQSYKPGPKDFDFYVNQVSYSTERGAQVTFSDGYYEVNQALVAKKGSPLAAETTVAGLQPYKLGAQIGTTSFQTIEEVVGQDPQDIAVFDQSTDVLQAFNNGTIDGYVVDAPTAYVNVLIGEAKKAVVAGQFPYNGEYFGLVLEQGNPFVECVNLGIQELKDDGTLAGLEEKYLADVTYPVFT